MMTNQVATVRQNDAWLNAIGALSAFMLMLLVITRINHGFQGNVSGEIVAWFAFVLWTAFFAFAKMMLRNK